MTSREAIHNFISGIFGTAVPSGSVYSGKSKPLLSYAAYSAPLSPVFGAKAEGFIDYYYIDDWDSGAAAENALAEFSRQVGLDGKTIDFDESLLHRPLRRADADRRQHKLCHRFPLGDIGVF